MSNTEQSQNKESIKLVNNALNKACKTGAFTLDESYVIRIAMSNLEKAVDLLEQPSKGPSQGSSQQQYSLQDRQTGKQTISASNIQ